MLFSIFDPKQFNDEETHKRNIMNEEEASISIRNEIEWKIRGARERWGRKNEAESEMRPATHQKSIAMHTQPHAHTHYKGID